MADIGVWTAIGALAFSMLCSGVTIAFFLGRLTERQVSQHRRITKLEDSEDGESKGATALAVEVGKLTATVNHMAGDVDAIKRNLGWMGRIANIGEAAPAS